MNHIVQIKSDHETEIQLKKSEVIPKQQISYNKVSKEAFTNEEYLDLQSKCFILGYN